MPSNRPETLCHAIKSPCYTVEASSKTYPKSMSSLDPASFECAATPAREAEVIELTSAATEPAEKVGMMEFERVTLE